MTCGDTDVASVAALIGDPARARILLALSANQRFTASALAAEAGLSAPATSAHLRKLLDSGLVEVAREGRYRHYRIAGRDVVAALESLARLAPAHPVRSLRQEGRGRALRFARVCYDHLAGRLAVLVVEALIARRAVTSLPTPAAHLGDALWTAGPRARPVFGELGVSAEALAPGQPLPPCLDWSVGRPHLAGAPGAALLDALLANGWLARLPRQRAVRVTGAGREGLRAALGIEPA
ncbi:ArsR/SmtB family transcription factor [Pseudonocardia acaciae]|uniref:ArsR/SmtB family transcription factor n=1 Tax=Pseudonocardia acaciae TaxID=551276 RepID=UPI00048BCCA8|nr:winged helix-turn-helix domain-containing protein [Pseudonocardia acaciae]